MIVIGSFLGQGDAGSIYCRLGDFEVKRHKGQAAHTVDICHFRKWYLRLIKSVADMRGRSSIFGEGRKSLSHMDTISVSLEKRSRHELSILHFWYSVNGVWDKREKVDGEKRGYLYIGRLVRTRVAMI